ncbi:DUF4124 domain-containing protein [Seongchinamella sediminis]|uniref:DUF4124 domain-containing protein n=1 Tax=Seongchinamella sediminis TaxID=2283635 RepID=A0A3L7E0Y1_9GAMM|nr:DUF4124 domain-containing protein [Seongchinamella sediminis]RLQ22589.1 DUF4124 domain-containing protein [Seongchinamella sediminis]
MNKIMSRGLLLAALLAAPQLSVAEVFMCTDPVSGKKTFTDKACPTSGERKKVKVQPTNFGQGSKTSASRGTWSSDRDTSKAGRENLQGHSRRVESARYLSNND